MLPNVFLFPGQGSQAVGMGADLFHSDPGFNELVDFAGKCAGADLRQICLRGPERALVKTEYLQPLLVAVSLGYYRRLVQAGAEPGLVLGHSLGEITALGAAGVFSLETAIQVAAQRGALMAAAAAQNPGGLLAVLSPERERVIQAVARLLAGGCVFLANDNAPSQVLFSGAAEPLEELTRLLSEAKLGPCKRLPVSGPWHSTWMRPAQEVFAAWLATIDFQAPRVPILMNVSASLESEPATIRELVVRNLTEPVRWRECMDYLKTRQPGRLFEIGPGRVLSGLARANGFGPEFRIYNINNLRGLNLALGDAT